MMMLDGVCSLFSSQFFNRVEPNAEFQSKKLYTAPLVEVTRLQRSGHSDKVRSLTAGGFTRNLCAL
jgi:hypothetical protein